MAPGELQARIVGVCMRIPTSPGTRIRMLMTTSLLSGTGGLRCDWKCQQDTGKRDYEMHEESTLDE